MTALKAIPKATVSGAIKLARLPADTALRAAPESVASSAGLAVDRADAAVRSAAGTALRDPQLRDEAKRLHEAIAERRRARGLRARASERIEEGEERAETARAEAEERRRLADQDAKRKREHAQKRREQERAEAKKAKKQRKRAAQKRADKERDKLKDRAQAGRLDALEAKAGALKERERALTEADEAHRLENAAARAKQERKRVTRGLDSNGRD